MIWLLMAACTDKPVDDSAPVTDTDADTDADADTDTDTDTDTTGEADSLERADVRITGAPSDAAGNSVAAAGDVNLDGYADIIVSAYYGNRACVFEGPIAAGDYALSAGATCFTGEGRYDFLGYDAEGAGDVTGDGVPDVLLGAIGNADFGTNAGKVYLVAGPLAAGEVAVAGSQTSWTGEASGDYLGVAVRHVGDVTGDGAPDIALGASGNDGSGAGGGKLYIWSGPFDTPGATFAAADTPIQVEGQPLPTSAPPPHGSYGGGDAVGDAVAGPGDVNGDGVDDLLVGAPGNATNGSSSGMAALFFGPLPDAATSVSDGDYLIFGTVEAAYLASPLDAAGDTDDDGLKDYFVSSDGEDAGVVYLITGSNRTGEASAPDAAATRFLGDVTGDQAGFGLAGGGDVNGDGVPDVLIGAPSHDRPAPGCGEGETVSERYDAGITYVVAGPFAPGVIDLSTSPSWGGACAGDNAGRSLAFAGDVNGDGADDALFGAIYNDDGGAFAGKAYLFYDSD